MIKLTYEEFFPFNTDNTLFASKIIITIIVKVFFLLFINFYSVHGIDFFWRNVL